MHGTNMHIKYILWSLFRWNRKTVCKKMTTTNHVSLSFTKKITQQKSKLPYILHTTFKIVTDIRNHWIFMNKLTVNFSAEIGKVRSFSNQVLHKDIIKTQLSLKNDLVNGIPVSF